MDTTDAVKQELNSYGFILMPAGKNSRVYMLDLGEERYVLISNTDGTDIPHKLTDGIRVTLFEWVGPNCYERWSGLYRSLDRFAFDMCKGMPWKTHPQCWNDKCREKPVGGKMLCAKCIKSAI